MADKNEGQRFVFFKYVPPKKEHKPIKDEYSKKTDTGAEWFGPSDDECPQEPGYPACPEEPEHGEYPEYPEYPDIPEVPEYPSYPGEGECPEMPEYPACPEIPEEPECPELPEVPECPELPEVPECPELPEVPECPECPECPEVPPGPCPENSVIHVIQAGDTFWKLAKRYGTSVEAIAAANPDADPLNLQIGETLCIPLGIPGAKG